MDREYEEKDAEFDSEMLVQFESDRIDIDIPSEGIVVEGGWKIIPLYPPVVCLIITVFSPGKFQGMTGWHGFGWSLWPHQSHWILPIHRSKEFLY